jgi:hypothetical protein
MPKKPAAKKMDKVPKKPAAFPKAIPKKSVAPFSFNSLAPSNFEDEEEVPKMSKFFRHLIFDIIKRKNASKKTIAEKVGERT